MIIASFMFLVMGGLPLWVWKRTDIHPQRFHRRFHRMTVDIGLLMLTPGLLRIPGYEITATILGTLPVLVFGIMVMSWTQREINQDKEGQD